MKSLLLRSVWIFAGAFSLSLLHAADAPPKATPVAKAAASEPATANEYVGHRYFEDLSGGWGWIKKTDEPWNKAVWVTLKETPGVSVAPFRSLPSRQADHDHEYRIWGHFANYTAYDPHRDELLTVFVIDHFQDLGAAAPLKLRPGPPGRAFEQRKSGAASKGRTIPTGADDDF